MRWNSYEIFQIGDIPMNTLEQSKGRSLKGYLLAGFAVVTCPCHLVIALSLLSGTVAGAFLSEHIVVASLSLLLVFILSSVGAFRLLRSDPQAGDGSVDGPSVAKPKQTPPSKEWDGCF